MAFTPTIPPNPQHIAEIAEALCARQQARQRDARANAQAQRILWNTQLFNLRNTAPPKTPHVNTTGPAAVLQARLARICPPAKQQIKNQPPAEQVSQAHVDAYYQRMTHYFTPVTDLPTTARSAKVSETVTPPPEKHPRPPQRTPSNIPRRLMEPVLKAAPVRPAILPMPVKPLLKGVKAIVKQPVQPEAEQEEEQVQRPSLIDAVVNAVHNFIDGIFHKDQQDQKKSKEAEAVAW